jgi:hypothetical protein
MANTRSRSKHAGGTKLIAALLSLTFGLLIWSLHLTLVYGVHTIACARDFTPTWIFGLAFPVLAIVVITVVGVLVTGVGGWWLAAGRRNGSAELRQEKEFERRVILLIAFLASVGMFWAGAAALFVSPCLALR